MDKQYVVMLAIASLYLAWAIVRSALNRRACRRRCDDLRAYIACLKEDDLREAERLFGAYRNDPAFIAAANLKKKLDALSPYAHTASTADVASGRK